MTIRFLFTAFEPSGDTLAAAAIKAIRNHTADIEVTALGGPQISRAGAQLLEDTTQHAVMLTGVISQWRTHRQRLARLQHWLEQNDIDAFIPVDSPAANWAICQMVRRTQPNAKIIHLVAPQLWAWAPWRIKKLRRLTDHVLCLLPFEPAWFSSRGVRATFVSHPLFDNPPPSTSPITTSAPVKLALLPGSRLSEIRANWPTMLNVFDRLARQHTDLSGIVAAHDQRGASLISKLTRSIPQRLEVRTGQTDDVLAWCDLALVVSGTATLQVTAHTKPMVVLYNVNPLAWHALGRWLISTRTFSLPNLIAQTLDLGRIVPEFVPHFAQPTPVTDAVAKLVDNDAIGQTQRAELCKVAACFEGQSFSQNVAAQILGTISNPAQKNKAPS